VLIGFMGAGKSTVGALLAARLGWALLDSDALIAAAEGCSVAQFFARHGESRFREVEAAVIGRLLDPAPSTPRAVLALGGGALESAAVRERLHGPAADPGIASVFLSAPVDELLQRCGAAGPDGVAARPLLGTAESPAERLARRLPHYRRAHFTVETAGRTADQVAGLILGRFEREPGPPAEG
jgi:shikimate kinase